MPVLWLGWPAVYLFLAVSLNQWASIQEQRQQLDATERDLNEVSARNTRREEELETLSAIHTTIMSGSDETASWTRSPAASPMSAAPRSARSHPARRHNRPAAVLACGLPGGSVQPLLPGTARRTAKALAAGRCCTAASPSASNVFEDPRYERMRDFAALVGIASSAAAPIELDRRRLGALVICYPETREFPATS